MKIAILGDLHFGARNNSEYVMHNQKKFFNFFFDYLTKNSITTIVQLGDIFDNRRNTNSKTLKFAYDEFFDKLSENNIKFYSLVGNHCMYWRESCDISTSDLLLRQYNNITVYDSPQIIEFSGKQFDVIPWICDANKEECMEFIKNSTSDYIFGHFEINSFEVTPGVEFVTGLNVETFKKYKKVFSGHFHQRSDRGNICYVGTPYELTWGDVKFSKAFDVFDTETETYEMIENPNKCFYYLEYDDVKKKYSDLDSIDLKDCFIKLVVYNKKEPYLFNNFMSKLFDKKPADVKVIENRIVNLSESVEENFATKSMQDIIRDYIKETNYTNKEELTNYMVNLYNEALSGTN